jgi:hypothetical protein
VSFSIVLDKYHLDLTDEEKVRFESLVIRTDGCHHWTGYSSRGYGQFKLRGKFVRPHVLAFLLSGGALPKGHCIDHLCRNRGCVNPAHLEPVTVRENVLRGKGVTAQSARKTHCINGHELSGDNVYIQKKRPRNRGCRACLSARRLDYAVRHRDDINLRKRERRLSANKSSESAFLVKVQ